MVQSSAEILSQIIVYSKYARYLEDEKRRETWEEIVSRNMEMHIRKFPELEDEIREKYKFVYDKKVLPSMRFLHFSGKPIELNNARGFNCCYVIVDDWRVFPEIMFLLLSGVGIGFSVQKQHVEKLPEIRKPLSRKRRYVVSDSVMGWADCIKMLIKSYFYGTETMDFDFSDVREKGARLITSGGKAPGAEPLRQCVKAVRAILETKQTGSKLKPIEVHEIVCTISNAVLSGGIRRSSALCMFSLSDKEMLECKSGDWFEKKPHLARANNSVVLLRYKHSKKSFLSLFEKIKENGTGEPGYVLSNDKDYGFNACAEASLRNASFCNLTEINFSTIESQKDLNERVSAASFIGTLQASYTNFNYLRSIWKKNTEKDSLLGISMTGLASRNCQTFNFEEAVKIATEENERVAGLINIKPAKRLTNIKPAGTTSLVLGTSSGIHAWHGKFYIRRVRINKSESLYRYLLNKIPNLVEDDKENSATVAIISIPMKAPEGAILREQESPLELLERMKWLHEHWIAPGHIDGPNMHNVSITVNLKAEDWEKTGEWLWENREFYNCVSVFPYDGGNYVQTPLEVCTEEKYNELMSYAEQIDLREVVEESDETKNRDAIACSGGSCEIRKV